MKEYSLYYYSKLGCRRKPSVLNLLLEQKDKIIYSFRKKRESSRRNCNCIYFSDINKYCMILATLVDKSDISIGAVILDDDALLEKLQLSDPSLIPNINFNECYSKSVYPSLAEEGKITLEEINAVRMELSKIPSWSYIKPMTEEEYFAPCVFESVTLPQFHEMI